MPAGAGRRRPGGIVHAGCRRPSAARSSGPRSSSRTCRRGPGLQSRVSGDGRGPFGTRRGLARCSSTRARPEIVLARPDAAPEAARRPPPTRRPAPEAEARDRPPQRRALLRRLGRRPAAVLQKARHVLARGLREDASSPTASSFRDGRDRPVRRAVAAAEPAVAEGLRRAEVHRLRGRARRLPRRLRLRHPARAQGHQGRARSGRWSSASTAWKAGRRTWPTRRSTTRPTTSSPPGWPSGASSRSRPQNPYIFEDRFRTLQRKANPLRQDAVLGHRPAAPADHRLAEDAAVRRPDADRASTA